MASSQRHWALGKESSTLMQPMGRERAPGDSSKEYCELQRRRQQQLTTHSTPTSNDTDHAWVSVRGHICPLIFAP